MENKTAIQQAIETLKKKSQGKIPMAAFSAYQMAIGVLINILPIEREQIETAYIDGMRDERGNMADKLGYFENNYPIVKENLSNRGG